MHPPLLDEIGLRSALGWYVDGLSKRGGIEITMGTKPRDFPRLAPKLETTLFRVIQEALTNVFRHSRASKACVTLEKRENEIAATIQDDGVGVSEGISEFRHNSIGVGIGGMRQRIKEVGGELFLRNARPGTLVEVVIPVPSMQSELQPVPAISSSSSSPKLKAKSASTGIEQISGGLQVKPAP